MITTFVSFFSIINILLSLIIVLFNWRINKNVVFLALFLTLYSLESIAYSIFIYGGNLNIYTLLFIISPFYMLKAPMLFFFIRGISNDKFYFRTVDLIHFLPFFIHLISNSSYLLFSYETKLLVSELLLNDYDNFKLLNINTLYPLYWNNLFRALLFLIYVFASIVLIFKARRKHKHLQGKTDVQFRYVSSRLIIITIIILVLSLIQNFVNIIYLQTNDEVYAGTFVMFLIQVAVYLYFAITVYIFMNPRLLYGMPRNTFDINDVANYRIGLIAGDNADFSDDAYFQSLAERIMVYIDDEKPYLKQNFSPQVISANLQIPEHHVQYCLKEVLNTNFNKLKNQKRVEFAMKLKQIDDYANASVQQLAEICGFSTVSAFKSAFKDLTGSSPDNWMK